MGREEGSGKGFKDLGEGTVSGRPGGEGGEGTFGGMGSEVVEDGGWGA